MSATLYALVVLQGTTLTFSPGYTTAGEGKTRDNLTTGYEQAIGLSVGIPSEQGIIRETIDDCCA